MEFTINVNVNASPSLEALLDKLAAIVGSQAVNPAPAASVAPSVPQPAPQAASPVPQVALPVPQPVIPLAPPQTAPFAPPAVPVSAAPAYTKDQLCRAGAALASIGKMNNLMQLMNQFGVQTIDTLPAEQYGAFATALRGMGAQI